MERQTQTDLAIRPAAPTDLEAIEKLLSDAHLPLQGVSQHLQDFLVAQERDRVVAAIGYEGYGRFGLLRSAVVDPEFRGRGLGQRLIERLLAVLRDRGVQAVYLLTTTAEGYFPRFGFRRVGRDEVPAEVRESVEFREACPESAVAMVREVRGEK